MLSLAIRGFLVVFLLLLLGCNNGNPLNEGTTVKKGYTEVEKTERAKSVLIDIKGYTEAENIARAVKRLEATSHWIIENGITEILTNSAYKDKFDKLGMSGDGSSISTTKLKNEDELPFFIITDYSTTYAISLFKRSLYKEAVYEYWMIEINKNWRDAVLPESEYLDDCRFLITRSDSIKSHRTILKESGQFFHQYTEDNAVAISLDYENDMLLRYRLKAWKFPHCYKHYAHLTDNEVRGIGPNSGNFILVPVDKKRSIFH
jgi:hypothetical protein